MNLKPHLSAYTESNAKWFTDLNIKAKNIALLEENKE